MLANVTYWFGKKELCIFQGNDKMNLSQTLQWKNSKQSSSIKWKEQKRIPSKLMTQQFNQEQDEKCNLCSKRDA